MPLKRRKGKHAGKSPPAEQPESAATSVEDTNGNEKKAENAEPQVVLTSHKRRGVYHCDYCHADISQVPRIRCAVCPDFDLCLDCFATTDHAAALAKLKTAADVHDAANDGSIKGSSGISVAATNHDDTHGYRVADSTRYQLFPSRRSVAPSQPPSCVDFKSEKGDDDYKSEKEDSEEKSDKDDDEYKSEKEEEKEDSMDVDEKPVEEVPTEATEPMETENIVSQPEKDARESVADEAEAKEEVPTDEANQTNDQPSGTDENPDPETDTENMLVVQDDPKSVWTAEEDLRLLDAIATFGLGNWTDVAEAVGGPGSSGKTAKRCMERYIDDFLGRYGHVLPMYTVVEDDSEQTELEGDSKGEDGSRRIERTFSRTLSSTSFMSPTGARARKRTKVVPTSSLPGYDKVWEQPYLPPVQGVQAGQDVGRQESVRAELAYAKAMSQLPTKEEAENMRKEWMETRLNQMNGPTVLPARPEDIPTLPGSELAGYMPRRGEFDMEWENDAETILADMEFSPTDLPQDRQLKIQVIEIYNSKLDEREHRKKFLLSRNLLDYRKNQQEDLKLPRDERDLLRRMRLFERLHTPEEHQLFVDDILKAKRLRKEIAKLQMYRLMGITSLAEAEKFELDKNRRESQKLAQLQKDTGNGKGASGSGTQGTKASSIAGTTDNASLWKQYKTNNRSARRSTSRSEGGNEEAAIMDANVMTGTVAEQSTVAEVSADAKVSDSPAQWVSEKPPSPSNEQPSDAESKPTETSNTAAVEDQDDSELSKSPGYELLSPKEKDLCRKLSLLPQQYLDVKNAVIYESLQRGLLDKEGPGSSRRTIVKIDAEKRGDVVDFMVRAGWVKSTP